MQTVTHATPEEADAALATLGLTLEPLCDAVRAGYLARVSCTGNDAPFYPAMSQWNRTVRVLRERLLVEGWSKCDDGNFCTVVNPERTIAIAVASGCENTGNRDETPTTKSPKGPSTVGAVLVNATQLHLPDIVPPNAPVADDRITWFLLFHCDERELRAELSLPASMGHDGRPDAWKERIILPTMPLDPVVPDVAPDFGPDFDIDVKRRQNSA